MICQRCKIAHGEPVRGAYDAYRLAEVLIDICVDCVSEIEYAEFLYRRSGIEVSADSYGVGDGYDAFTMFDMEGDE